ncbi:UNVERIFIED_ORG: transcription elongation factor GreA, partial [Rhodanobacter sp. FW104-R5]
MSRAPITKTGAERLRSELERLKSADRPRIIAAIAEARAHGDLKENAEYHAARELQSFTEGRIAQLEALLSTAEVIDVAQLRSGGRVVFGATVDLEDEDTGAAVTYQIVGDLEADIKQRLIAV